MHFTPAWLDGATVESSKHFCFFQSNEPFYVHCANGTPDCKPKVYFNLPFKTVPRRFRATQLFFITLVAPKTHR